MRFSDIETMSQGVPEMYSGYEYVKADAVTGKWQFSDRVSVKRRPKFTVDADGNKVQILSVKSGRPIEDYVIFLPIIQDGKKVIVATKSPVLIRLFRQVECDETVAFRDSKLDILPEVIEGTFVFSKAKYDYANKKNVDVLNIEEVE